MATLSLSCGWFPTLSNGQSQIAVDWQFAIHEKGVCFMLCVSLCVFFDAKLVGLFHWCQLVGIRSSKRFGPSNFRFFSAELKGRSRPIYEPGGPDGSPSILKGQDQSWSPREKCSTKSQLRPCRGPTCGVHGRGKGGFNGILCIMGGGEHGCFQSSGAI